MQDSVTIPADVENTDLKDERTECDDAERCLDCGEVRFVCRCWPGEG